MSAMGHKETSAHVRVMSALPPIADIGTRPPNILLCQNARALTSPGKWCSFIPELPTDMPKLRELKGSDDAFGIPRTRLKACAPLASAAVSLTMGQHHDCRHSSPGVHACGRGGGRAFGLSARRHAVLSHERFKGRALRAFVPLIAKAWSRSSLHSL
jgi:hypothetical protein